MDDTNSWCFPCNNAHAPRKFSKGNLQQKIVDQQSQGVASDDLVYASLGMDTMTLITQMQGLSIEKEMEIALDHDLFSWREDEDIVLTNGAIVSSSGAPQV